MLKHLNYALNPGEWIRQVNVVPIVDIQVPRHSIMKDISDHVGAEKQD